MRAKSCDLRAVNVHFGTFDFAIHVIVGPHSQVEKYVRWKHDSNAINWNGLTCRGTTFIRYGYVPIIWLPRKPQLPREYGTLAHEMMHAIRVMLVDWAGMPLTADSDEAFCHAMGYGMRKVLERL